MTQIKFTNKLKNTLKNQHQLTSQNKKIKPNRCFIIQKNLGPYIDN